jgi:hypothetical protein
MRFFVGIIVCVIGHLLAINSFLRLQALQLRLTRLHTIAYIAGCVVSLHGATCYYCWLVYVALQHELPVSALETQICAYNLALYDICLCSVKHCSLLQLSYHNISCSCC